MRSRRFERLPGTMAAKPPGDAYARHIKSEGWRTSDARLGEIEAADRRCRLCDRGEPEVVLTVHHRTYANLGREKQRDLTCLCLDCHDAVTGFLRAGALALIRVPEAVDVPAALPGRHLRDSIMDGGAR